MIVFNVGVCCLKRVNMLQMMNFLLEDWNRQVWRMFKLDYKRWLYGPNIGEREKNRKNYVITMECGFENWKLLCSNQICLQSHYVWIDSKVETNHELQNKKYTIPKFRLFQKPSYVVVNLCVYQHVWWINFCKQLKLGTCYT